MKKDFPGLKSGLGFGCVVCGLPKGKFAPQNEDSQLHYPVCTVKQVSLRLVHQ